MRLPLLRIGLLLLLCGCKDGPQIGGAMVGAALPVALAYTLLFLMISRLDRPPTKVPWGELAGVGGAMGAVFGMGALIRWDWVRDGLDGEEAKLAPLLLFPWMIGGWLVGRVWRPEKALLIPAGFVLFVWQLPALVCMSGAREICNPHQLFFIFTAIVLDDFQEWAWGGMLVVGLALVIAEALWRRKRKG